MLGYSLVFSQWTGDSTSTSRTTTIYMDRDKTVTASYTASTTPCSSSAGTDGRESPAGDVLQVPPLSLLVISDGSGDVLHLTWLGGPETAEGWQYRQRAAGTDSWGAWTDVTAPERTYSVSGLESGTAYDFQVRTAAGVESNVHEGATRASGATPALSGDRIGAGDGVLRWNVRGHFTVVIPNDMVVRSGEADGSVTLQDMGSGSYMVLLATGAELSRELHPDPEGRNVGALLDQVVASVAPVH